MDCPKLAYLVKLAPDRLRRDDVDGIRELRSLLKRLLRGGGFRAVSIREARRDD